MPSKSSTNLQDDDELSFLDDEKSNVSDDIDDISGTTKGESALRQRKSEKSSF